MFPDTEQGERHRIRRLFNRYAVPLRLLDAHLEREYARSIDRIGLDDGLTILDLATGSGNLAAVLAARGHRVVGVDFAERALVRARAKVRDASFMVMDLAELGCLRSGMFDVVAIAYALHGMPEPLRRHVLLESARLTRRWVLVLDYDSLGPWYVRIIERLEGPHYRTFVATALEPRLVAAGLEVVRRDRFSAHGGLWLCGASITAGIEDERGAGATTEPSHRRGSPNACR